MRKLDIVMQAKVIHVVASAIFLLSGVFLMIYPDLNSMALRLLLGIGLIVTGSARVLGYFSNDLYQLAFQFDLAMGGFCVIMGTAMLIPPLRILTMFTFAIGMFALIDGLLKLQISFDAKTFGMKMWVGLLVSAAVLSMGGVLVLVAPPSWNRVLLTGGALAAIGAENIWNTMATVRVRAKKKDKFEDLLND